MRCIVKLVWLPPPPPPRHCPRSPYIPARLYLYPPRAPLAAFLPPCDMRPGESLPPRSAGPVVVAAVHLPGPSVMRDEPDFRAWCDVACWQFAPPYATPPLETMVGLGHLTGLGHLAGPVEAYARASTTYAGRWPTPERAAVALWDAVTTCSGRMLSGEAHPLHQHATVGRLVAERLGGLAASPLTDPPRRDFLLASVEASYRGPHRLPVLLGGGR